MKRLIGIMLLATSAVFGAQSVVLSSTSQANATAASAAPWSAVGSFRLEFRIHGYNTPPDANQWLWTAGNLNAAGVGVRFLPEWKRFHPRYN